jgi:uncharacterized protein
MLIERKSFCFEVKNVNDAGRFSGYASTFGNTDLGGDIVMPGAFKSFLDSRGTQPLPALWQHNPDEPIGVFDLFSEDQKGLVCEGQLQIKVGRGLEAHELLKMQAITGLSIGYITRDYSIDEATGTRQLKNIDLKEISLVTFPMNELAQITDVKSIADLNSLSDCEQTLREVGMSRAAAKAFIAQVKKYSGQREVDFEKSFRELMSNNTKTLKEKYGSL